jgi:hypothetical protein
LCRGSSGGDCPGELVIERDELILSMGDRSDMRDTTDIVFK